MTMSDIISGVKLCTRRAVIHEQPSLVTMYVPARCIPLVRLVVLALMWPTGVRLMVRPFTLWQRWTCWRVVTVRGVQ